MARPRDHRINRRLISLQDGLNGAVAPIAHPSGQVAGKRFGA